VADLFVCNPMIRWVWAEAGAQPHVEEALSIGGFGYPVSDCMILLFFDDIENCLLINGLN